MSKPLTHFVKSSKEISALKDIIVHEDGLSYHEVFYKTNLHSPVSHIGAEARKQAREKQISFLSTKIQGKDIELENANHELEKLTLRVKNIKKAPKKSLIESLKREKELTFENLETEREKQIDLKEQIQKLQSFPITHLIIKKYSLDELEKMVFQYNQFVNEKQRLTKELEFKTEEFQRVSKEYELYKKQNNQLEEEISQLKEQEQQLLKEIEALENDESYLELSEEKEALELKESILRKETEDLFRTEGALNNEISEKGNRFTKNTSDLKEKQEKYKTINKIVNEFLEGVDDYSLEYKPVESKDILDEKNLQVNKKVAPNLELPKTEKTDFLLNSLSRIEKIEILDLTINASHDCKHYMDKIKKEIENHSNTSEELFKLAESILKTSLFSLLKTTYELVLDGFDDIKESIETPGSETPGSSKLKLYFDYHLKEKDAKKVEMLQDSGKQELFAKELNKTVCEQIELSNHTIDDEQVKSFIFEELDPIKWFDLKLYYTKDDIKKPLLLTNGRFKTFSNGEKCRVLYIPTLSLLKIMIKQMKQDAPLLIIMDEAFKELDGTQTQFFLNEICKVSDLFMLTIPKDGKLPSIDSAKDSTKRIDIIRLMKCEMPDGSISTFSLKEEFYEEVLNE